MDERKTWPAWLREYDVRPTAVGSNDIRDVPMLEGFHALLLEVQRLRGILEQDPPA